MAKCVCCCPNRPVDGQLCLADYTQIVITLDGVSSPPENPGLSCGCANGLVVIADYINEEQVFETNACDPGFEGSVARVRVLPTLPGFVGDCQHVSPGFLGVVETSGPASPGQWFPQALFQVLIENIPYSGGVLSEPEESCGDFSARIGRDTYTEGAGFEVDCIPGSTGTWELQ